MTVDRIPYSKNTKIPIEKQALKKRVTDYLTKTIKRSKDGYTTLPIKKLAKALHRREADVRKELNLLVADGVFKREELPNKNRANPKFKHSLGSPNKIVRGENQMTEIETVKLRGLNTWGIADRLDLIDMYLQSGMDIIPLDPRSKKRMFYDESWDRDYKGKPTKILNFFATKTYANVGLRMRGDFVVVDIDCLPQWLEKTHGETWDTLSSASGKPDREHLWFSNNTGIKVNYPKVFGGLADIQVTNNVIMVLPPSIHPSGTQYRWTNLIDPTDTPDYIIDLFSKKGQMNPGVRDLPTVQPVSPGSKTLRHAAPAKRELPDFIDKSRNPDVSRHLMYFSYGRSLLRLGTPIDDIAQKLVNYNATNCKPPKSDRELREIIRQIEYGTNRPDYVVKENK